jgi:hypothetical protein
MTLNKQVGLTEGVVDSSSANTSVEIEGGTRRERERERERHQIQMLTAMIMMIPLNEQSEQERLRGLNTWSLLTSTEHLRRREQGPEGQVVCINAVPDV